MLRLSSLTSSDSMPSSPWSWRGSSPSACRPAPTAWCTGGWRYPQVVGWAGAAGSLGLCLTVSSPQGFVAAISPFNFTAIGGNLAGAPALMVRCGQGVGMAGASHCCHLNRQKTTTAPQVPALVVGRSPEGRGSVGPWEGFGVRLVGIPALSCPG